jgi:tetratricopeptide (TPR) repeat protein
VAGVEASGPNTRKTEHQIILDCLAQLRGHSLIHPEESSAAIRFRMLETLREFAAEQVTPEDREEMAQRHAAYFHQWVTGARLIEANKTAWFERFEEDFDNLRAVLAWSLRKEGEIEIGLQTANAFGKFWWLRGHLSEGRMWYARLLEHAGETATEELGHSLHRAGTLAYLQGDFQTALPLLERCMEIARTSHNETLMGNTHETLGSVAYRQGDYNQARLHFEQSLTLARTQGTRLGIASALGNLANVAQASGDFTVSRDLNAESLEIWREEGDRNGEARTLHNLANLAHSQGQLVEARAYLDQSLAIKRELADRFGISSTLRGIAEIAIAQEDYVTAVTHARESLVMTREMDGRMDIVDTLHLLINLAQAVGELEVSVRMYSALEKIREEMNYPLPPVDREEYEHVQMGLRASLGITEYEAARVEGRKLSLEEALAILEETLASRS